MKYLFSIIFFLVLSTAATANDRAPLKQVRAAETGIDTTVLLSVVTQIPELEEVELSTTSKTVILYWNNGTRSYEKAALLPLSDMDAMLEKAEASDYTVQLVLQTQHWFLICVIDDDNVERYYFSYYERPTELWEEGDVD